MVCPSIPIKHRMNVCFHNSTYIYSQCSTYVSVALSPTGILPSVLLLSCSNHFFNIFNRGFFFHCCWIFGICIDSSFIGDKLPNVDSLTYIVTSLQWRSVQLLPHNFFGTLDFVPMCCLWWCGKFGVGRVTCLTIPLCGGAVCWSLVVVLGQ